MNFFFVNFVGYKEGMCEKEILEFLLCINFKCFLLIDVYLYKKN